MKKRHPYIGLPDNQFWKNDPGIKHPNIFDPISAPPFQISKSDRVVTAGSCFAQHVARHLSSSGFNHYIAEPAHPFIPKSLAGKFGYNLFSARYGNIYTARQLLQTLQRAYGQLEPKTTAWPKGQGSRTVDPFRPQIQPNGFISEEELVADREVHFSAIRDAVETMDVFVFTLGLTECWEDKRDGMIYPLAPGVAGGQYDTDLVQFRNFDEIETADDLRAALNFIRDRNPTVRIILTVSPVPLNATMENRHVFVSTTWSKAVLRLAAEKLCQELETCCYFPSYEIITSPHVRGNYFGADCREVLPQGVDHVMRLFFKHFAGLNEGKKSNPVPKFDSMDQSQFLQEIEDQLEILCDEEAISNQ